MVKNWLEISGCHQTQKILLSLLGIIIIIAIILIFGIFYVWRSPLIFNQIFIIDTVFGAEYEYDIHFLEK